MKTVKNACKLQPNATEIYVGDQIEQLDQLINDTDGNEYFGRTHITDGMKILVTKGIARLAGKSNDTVFHLKQAMGGGKTHLMIGLGILAKNSKLRAEKIGEIPYQDKFGSVGIAAINGRRHPKNYFWGDIARQLGKESLFKEYWEFGPKAPDEYALEYNKYVLGVKPWNYQGNIPLFIQSACKSNGQIVGFNTPSIIKIIEDVLK